MIGVPQRQGKGTQRYRRTHELFTSLVPETKAFSFLVQSLPLLRVTALYERHKYALEKGLGDFVIHPAALVAFSRGLNLIIARIILNGVFVYDCSSTLRSISRRICITKDEVFEMDPYFSKRATRGYPLMRDLLYDLKSKKGQLSLSGSASTTEFETAESNEKLKRDMLYYYVSESKFGSGCRTLVLSMYAKSLTSVHINEGRRLTRNPLEHYQTGRDRQALQLPPYLLTEQLDAHQLALNPCINWVLIAIYNLPYKYEMIRFVRTQLLMVLWRNNLLKPPRGYSASDLALSEALDFCINSPGMGELSNTIVADNIDKGVYYLVEYWIKMSFFFHVTDFSIYDLSRPIQQDQKVPPEQILFTMHPRPIEIDGISLKALESALLSYNNISIPPDKTDIYMSYFGEYAA